MGNKNDERIMQLQATLKTKQEELKKRQSKFSPVTTCMIDMDGKRYNLHTCSKDELLYMLVRLNSMNLSIHALLDSGIEEMGLATKEELQQLKISGFTIDQWIEDIQSKLGSLSYQKAKNELNNAGKQLDALLSNDKKTELAIDNIAKLLES